MIVDGSDELKVNQILALKEHFWKLDDVIQWIANSYVQTRWQPVQCFEYVPSSVDEVHRN
jgi:hypothetical protein